MRLKDKSNREKEEFIQFALDKVNFYIESKFWSKFEIPQLRLWLSNFASLDEKYCAACLLDRFVYYSETDIIRLLKYGVMEKYVRTQILEHETKNDFLTSELAIEGIKNDFFSDTSIMPLTAGNPSESSYTIARYLSLEIGINELNIINPLNIDSNYLSKFKRVLIVDDFIGSGEQIIDFWNTQDIQIDNQPSKMYELAARYKNIEFSYFCLVATEEGIKTFYDEDSVHNKNLKIVFCEKLSDKFKIFGNRSVYFTIDEIEECTEILGNLCRTKGIGLKGYNGLDYAIAFHHDVPDATLPLFFECNDSWNYLLKNKKTKEHAEF